MNEEEVSKIIDINDEILETRIEIIKEDLQKIINDKRSSLDETKTTEEMIADINFKSWVIANEVMKMISSNENFSRLFYFMHGHFNGDINKVLENYDVEFITDENGNLKSINLITLEEDYG